LHKTHQKLSFRTKTNKKFNFYTLRKHFQQKNSHTTYNHTLIYLARKCAIIACESSLPRKNKQLIIAHTNQANNLACVSVNNRFLLQMRNKGCFLWEFEVLAMVGIFIK
jgi:hypothetical protein